MGQFPVRTGMTTIGIPGSTRGIQKTDPTLAEVLKSVGYSTGQFGKNHLGDRNEFLPTVHGFDEWFGNLYHLKAEEEPEELDYPGRKTRCKPFFLWFNSTAIHIWSHRQHKYVQMAVDEGRAEEDVVRRVRGGTRSTTGACLTS
jgi:sulfatase-like protein